MLVGLYGGTFDPVHLGHVHVASSVQAACDLSEIRWLLAARPGHRAKPCTTIEHRWNMLQLVCRDHQGFVADDTEIKSAGTSYTYKTLVEFRRRSPEAIPCWILGLDAFVTLNEWYRWQSILDHANLIVVERPNAGAAATTIPAVIADIEARHGRKQLDGKRTGQIVRLDLPMLPISATQIRTKLRLGESVDDLLVPGVSAYITENQLYAENSV